MKVPGWLQSILKAIQRVWSDAHAPAPLPSPLPSTPTPPIVAPPAAPVPEPAPVPDPVVTPQPEPAPVPLPPVTPPPAPVGDLLTRCIIHDSPADMGTWPITARITSVDFSRGFVEVEFDKRDGPDRWPDVTPPGWDGPLQYTLGMCQLVGNEWHASAVVQFWHGRTLTAGGETAKIGLEWFYDASRWAPMRQPFAGELLGFFVVAGNCRAHSHGNDGVPLERSNVALVNFDHARHEF